MGNLNKLKPLRKSSRNSVCWEAVGNEWEGTPNTHVNRAAVERKNRAHQSTHTHTHTHMAPNQTDLVVVLPSKCTNCWQDFPCAHSNCRFMGRESAVPLRLCTRHQEPPLGGVFFYFSFVDVLFRVTISLPLFSAHNFSPFPITIMVGK